MRRWKGWLLVVVLTSYEVPILFKRLENGECGVEITGVYSPSLFILLSLFVLL